MILTAHQPAYLPWLGLFHKIALADEYVSFNQVQYQPEEWVNRNKIKTTTGPIWLTIPVKRRGFLDKTVSDIEIDNSLPWARKHWRALQTNYRRTPYFSRYADFFEEVYTERRWARLVDLNEFMLAWLLDALGIACKLRSAADYEFRGAKSALVLDMCRQLGARVFIFGAQGRDYADVAAFRSAGIEPLFQDYRHPVYPQLHGAFCSHMSVVDLLFNCGPSSLDVLMSGNVGRSELSLATN